MAKRKLVLVAGALVLAGGAAAAIAAVGHREARMGHRGGMHDMGEIDETGGRGMGRGHGRWSRDDHDGRGHGMGGRGGDDMMGEGRGGRGFMRRGMTAEDFDTRTRERFARLDRNSDGVIDAAEVEAGLSERASGRGPVGRFMERRRERAGDAADTPARTRQAFLDRVRRGFQRMDLDGDGRITDADLPPMMRGRDVLKGGGDGFGRGALGGMGRGMGLGALMGADANKDGVITLDEVLAAAGRRFDLMDRNKDGTFDQADRDAIVKETTDYRVRRFMHAFGAKDGRITREQFFAAAKERFNERDANNDGRIDRQDFGRGRGPGRGSEGGQAPVQPDAPAKK